MDKITITNEVVLLEKLAIHDPEVVTFFAEAPEEARVELASKALSLGVVGLKAMGVAGRVEVVEKEFLKLAHSFDSALREIEDRLMGRVESTFDPDEAESVSARMGLTISDAYKAAGELLESTKREMERLVADSFNPDLASSCVHRIIKLVADTRAELDRAFDPSFEGSHLSRLAGMIDEYFGDSGTVSEVVAAEVAPIKEEVLRGLQELRDVNRQRGRSLTGSALVACFGDRLRERSRGSAATGSQVIRRHS